MHDLAAGIRVVPDPTLFNLVGNRWVLLLLLLLLIGQGGSKVVVGAAG